MKLLKTGALAFILLGILHLLTQVFGKPNDPNLDKLLVDMQNFKINFMGDHNMLKFHSGFSIMMGFLLSAFGIQNFLLAREILNNKAASLSMIAIAACCLIIAVKFFHVLAFGLIGISLVCFLVAFIRHSLNKKLSESQLVNV